MAIYAISDLHLSLGIDKPMDIFDEKWSNHIQKVKENWTACIRDEDYVLMPGDLSWATYLEQAYKDFDYINDLPGIKIISKGNHDYWWSTASKLDQYIQKNHFKDISFLHNNCYVCQNSVICGTRGWNCPGGDGFSQEDEKIYLRELQRLQLSLECGLKQRHEEIIVALHYPPVNRYKDMSSGFIEILKKYGVKTCIYGHLHAESQKNALVGVHEGIRFELVACDYMDFMPLKLRNRE